MKLVGKKVTHAAKFGQGIIRSQDEKYIRVEFFSSGEIKQFVFPDCFSMYLKLEDANAQIAIDTENAAHAEKEAKEAAERRKKVDMERFEQKSRQLSSSKTKQIELQTCSSVHDFCTEYEQQLTREVMYLRSAGGKRIRLMDGKLVEQKRGQYVYAFDADSEMSYPDNTQITLWKGKSSVPALIVNCEEFTVIVSTGEDLGQSIAIIEFTAEPWRLLNALVDRLKTIEQSASTIVNSLVCEGKQGVKFHTPIQTGQETACRMARSQPITFIWGPPGTGKTETLAKIAQSHIAEGHRVLMLSYSNVSVDGALLRVYQHSKGVKPGVLIRYGYPRDRELLENEFLTSYNLALKNHPELYDERKKLIEERKHLSHSSGKYVEAGNRLSQIRKQLSAEEKCYVATASFIATTVSKAVVDKAIYEADFDVVIFDEASMAYIPQIVFAASLATQNFICIGDFSQLPPIVQCDSTIGLNADIFRYCSVFDAVQCGYGHEWLCMLDVQYRMHPAIADFVSKSMYRGLLKSASDMLQKRKAIAALPPEPGKALCVADLSDMMSVCIKTADSSRINVLSALITMALASTLSDTCNVGVVTPYNAQARLLHAMQRDISESFPALHPITCATVHQFQGSEKDIILYDAVDCYRMKYPGVLLSSNTNNYANRLYNVAMTRARGKFIAVVNTDYMETKNLSSGLLFRKMIDEMKAARQCLAGNDLLASLKGQCFQCFDDDSGLDMFIQDIDSSKREISIDIPGTTTLNEKDCTAFCNAISRAKARGVKVVIRAESKKELPNQLKSFSIENQYVANPISLIDRRVVWFGMPPSGADFLIESTRFKTQYRAIIRFIGKKTASSLYGFLEMNRTVDNATAPYAQSREDEYDTFGAYVSATEKCPRCGSMVQLKKSKKGKFFLACSAYPGCEYTDLIKPELVDQYLYSGSNPSGKLCPRDHTSLEPKVGPYGLYITCGGVERHYFKLDEI